ncbi:MAG TPA: hypothetical protein PKC67_11520 [Kiritimatiellia bacterium]|nr:hypothetical protein [Kiritimatiellia bacterium]HMP34968.1 hypothetical protein [Kiritimatiellia bacterium]
MTQPLHMADAGLETIIYIIVVFFWVVGNFLSNAKRRKKRQEQRGGGGTPIPRPGESTAEAELREFLENLAGEPKTEEEPEEPLRPAPAPMSAPQPARRIRPHHRRPVFDPSEQSFASAPAAPFRVQRVLPPEPEPIIDLEAVARDLRDAAPSMASSLSTSLSSHGNLFKTAGQPLPSLRYALASNRPPPARPILRREQVRNPDTLRNLVAAQLILGAPRAFSPIDPGKAN